MITCEKLRATMTFRPIDRLRTGNPRGHPRVLRSWAFVSFIEHGAVPGVLWEHFCYEPAERKT